MQTGLVKSTGIQYLDSCSISALGRSHGAQRSKESCRCRVQRRSTLHRRMQPRRGSARSFMKEIWGGEEKLLTISCDNQGAIALAKDNKFHARTKHIESMISFHPWGSQRWKNSSEVRTNGWYRIQHLHQAFAEAKIHQVRGVVGLEEVGRHQSQA